MEIANATKPPVPDFREGVIFQQYIAFSPVRQGNSRGFPPPVSIQGRVRAPLRDALRSLRRGALCAPASRSAGRNPLGAILRLGRGKEDPSSVTAYAVTPSPRRGEGFGAALEAAPMGCLRSLRRGALCAPAGRPAGRNPLGAILRLGWGEEDPSSVTAYAVTPSPRRGGRLWGRRWKPPLRDAFGLCAPLRHVIGPGMAGRARLLCKGRNQNSGEDLCLPRPGQRLISRFSVRPRR